MVHVYVEIHLMELVAYMDGAIGDQHLHSKLRQYQKLNTLVVI